MVCNVFSLNAQAGELTGMSRMVAANTDGLNVKLVSRRDSGQAIGYANYGGEIVDWLPGQDGAVLITKIAIPKVNSDVTVIGGSFDGMGVDRVDTGTLSAQRVLPPVKSAVEYISDGHGTIRIMGVLPAVRGGEYDSRFIDYRFRPKAGGNWQLLGRYTPIGQLGFNPIAVDATEDVVYGMQKLDGRLALYKRTLVEAGTHTLVFSRPDVDVDGLIRLGRAGRIIGATFATERRQAFYFDAGLAKLAASLARALPNAPLINFEGASDDEQKLLLWAGSDTDPGRYYLLDRTTKQLKPLLLARPELNGVVLAPVKSVQVRAGDGSLVPGYLTLPPGSTGKGLPAIVMPHGGPWARDEWGFDWLAQYYANRGFAVLQPNFRGSSGYGDGWFVNNGFKSWRTAIGDVNDAGRWLVAQGIADPGKLAIVGWSYGGYAALQSNVSAPDLFKAIVAIAPVTDLAALKSQWRETSSSEQVRDLVGAGPHIVEGSPLQNIAAIRAPVLLFHGDLDQNVRVNQSKMMADRLKAAGKSVELVLYPGLQHQLDDSGVRADMLRRSDAFLRAKLGMK